MVDTPRDARDARYAGLCHHAGLCHLGFIFPWVYYNLSSLKKIRSV